MAVLAEFPRNIHHVVFGARTVHGSNELDGYLMAGWTVFPVAATPRAILAAKIAALKCELARLEAKLDAMKDD